MAVPTAEQMQWMQDNIEDTRVPGIHISNGICLAATTISLVLRFISRRTGGRGLGRDDYCLFLGYVGLCLCHRELTMHPLTDGYLRRSCTCCTLRRSASVPDMVKDDMYCLSLT